MDECTEPITEEAISAETSTSSEDKVLKMLCEMNKSMSQGFSVLSDKIVQVKLSVKREVPTIAKPDELEPTDERLDGLRKCGSEGEVWQLLPELFTLKIEHEDNLIYCPLCVPDTAYC